MGCTFFVYSVYSNLNTIFNNLDVIMTYCRFLANKNTWFWEAETGDFVKIFLRFCQEFLKIFVRFCQDFLKILSRIS